MRGQWNRQNLCSPAPDERETPRIPRDVGRRRPPRDSMSFAAEIRRQHGQ